MTGLLVELLVSWILLLLVQRKHLSVLGFMPNLQRVKDLAIGFLIATACTTGSIMLLTITSKSGWSINENFTLSTALASTWWTLRSVLMEEFLFRGALLYLAIHFLGLWRGCLLSSVCFGIYHWFSYGVLGHAGQMIVIFFITGIAGLLFSLGYAKTKSLYFPVGLHFGGNLLSIVIFSNGPLGQQLLIAKTGEPIQPILSLIANVASLLIFSLLTLWYLKYRGQEQQLKASVVSQGERL